MNAARRQSHDGSATESVTETAATEEVAAGGASFSTQSPFPAVVADAGHAAARPHEPTASERAYGDAGYEKPDLEASLDIPNRDALKPFGDNGYQSSTVDPFSLPRATLGPETQQLFPAHPDQTTKLYHVYKRAQYDQSKLTADDPACNIGQKKTSRADGRKACFRADSYEYAIISDIFMDKAGNYYRGFWKVEFMKKDENMGHLLSKGRTVYEDPTSQVKNEMYVGGTYPVNASDFMFVTPLLSGDSAKLAGMQKRIDQGFSLDPETHLFSPRNEPR